MFIGVHYEDRYLRGTSPLRAEHRAEPSKVLSVSFGTGACRPCRILGHVHF